MYEPNLGGTGYMYNTAALQADASEQSKCGHVHYVVVNLQTSVQRARASVYSAKGDTVV